MAETPTDSNNSSGLICEIKLSPRLRCEYKVSLDSEGLSLKLECGLVQHPRETTAEKSIANWTGRLERRGLDLECDHYLFRHLGLKSAENEINLMEWTARRKKEVLDLKWRKLMVQIRTYLEQFKDLLSEQQEVFSEAVQLKKLFKDAGLSPSPSSAFMAARALSVDDYVWFKRSLGYKLSKQQPLTLDTAKRGIRFVETAKMKELDDRWKKLISDGRWQKLTDERRKKLIPAAEKLLNEDKANLLSEQCSNIFRDKVWKNKFLVY